MFKSKILYLLVPASITMIALLILIWVNGNREIQQQFNFILSTEKIVKKMHLVAELTEKARARTRLTSQLIATDDFFIKDEISMQLDVEATNFVLARESFLKLPLNRYEQEMFEKQSKMTVYIVKNQNMAVEMAMADDPDLLIKAKKLQYEIVLPNQGKLVDLFMSMLHKYKNDINSQTIKAQNDYENNKSIRYFLLLIFLIIAVFITVYVSRKIYLIEKRLFIEKKRTHITLMSIGDAVITTDAKGIILDCNNIAEELLQLSTAQIIGQSFTSVVNLTDDNNFENEFLIQSLQENKKTLTENLQLNFENSSIYIELLFSPILEGKRKAGCVITFRDISEKKVLEKKLHKQARHDALTGLFNRYSFDHICQETLLKKDNRINYCLCVLDLDHFKRVNDSCGHKAGDQVLKEISAMMSLSIREHDSLCRIGGDEFSIILNDCNKENAELIMNKLINNISDYQYKHDNTIYTLGCSIGITQFHHSDKSCSDVFKRADTSCYKAKETGRNRVIVFS